jgi:hypothetical protein
MRDAALHLGCLTGAIHEIVIPILSQIEVQLSARLVRNFGQINFKTAKDASTLGYLTYEAPSIAVEAIDGYLKA